jgi:NAD(P)-dependent dehydrogenase (short-subunit alcohol dehydrogenase family)
MEIAGKVVVVTGGAGGIGSALARRFHREGANAVVVLDRDGEGAQTVAGPLEAERPGTALGAACDVAAEADLVAILRHAEATFGPIDVFCANAGIGIGTDLETPDADWQAALDVNVMAHVYAARTLVPGWLERGDGYFVTTASAAGLLTQIGSAPYAVSKHAAVAFAEWLSVTYGDRGLKVSCLCPMGVNTAMLNPPGGGTGIEALGGNVVKAAGEVLEPDEVADAVVRAMADETFLILPHPEVLTFFQRKASDYDRWLAGMRRLQARVVAE